MLVDKHYLFLFILLIFLKIYILMFLFYSKEIFPLSKVPFLLVSKITD